jgi:hypothetical protein
VPTYKENMASIFETQLSALDTSVDNYINDLISEAQGDRDFIVRQLDAQHKLALGTDDVARAQFFEKVADQLETRIGRIPYDYERFTKRELEDFARGETRLTENKDIALRRLAEDEAVLQRQLQQDVGQERQTQAEQLNARGILSSTREGAQGLAGSEVGRLERDVTARQEALNRAIGRSREETNQTFGRGIEDITTSKERNLEDLKTTARREGIDAQQSRDFGVESADRKLSAEKKRLERQRTLDRLMNTSFALTGA